MQIAIIIMTPPIKLLLLGVSPTPIQTHIGARTTSSMAKSTNCAAGTFGDASVIRVRPTPSCRDPSSKHMARSCFGMDREGRYKPSKITNINPCKAMQGSMSNSLPSRSVTLKSP